MDVIDLAIIGAGCYGLASAKTYLQLNPSSKVVVLEAATTVGGTWAEHRLYPGVKTNNLYGTYEFSDFPMDESTFEVGPGQHISGTVLHKYLDAYARKFDLLSRTRFNSCVTTIEQKEDSSWLLTVNVKRDDASGPCQYNLIARKLIIATGLTSEPRIPSFSGASSFQAPVVHSKNLPDYLKKLEEVKTVVVLGATKSGFDAVYEFASRNIHVHWVIRESGNGPVWILPPYVTRLKIQLEKLTQTRFITWLSPCIWGEADGYSTIRGYLHKTSIGRWFVDCYWRVMESYLLRLNRYDRCSETLKLKPWTKVFCTGTSQSILNYSTDFFELVRSGKVTVHISDITHLSQKTVHLADESVKADALICATGWKHLPQIKFLPEGLEADLGLPSPHTRAEDQESLAEKEIFESFPSLRSLSSPNSFRSRRTPADQRGLDATTRDTTHQPLRLYRFMVPPAFASQHNIGFAGMLMTINTMTSAEVQALWLCVYLSKGLGGLSTLPLKDLKWETMLHTQFCKLRYPQGFGHTFPDFLIDGLPYIDLLLRDLELPYRRKNGRLRELFEPYGPKDYKGLVEDWLYTTKLPHISCTMVERFPPNTLALSQSKKPKVSFLPFNTISLVYHAQTIWLFTYSNLKDTFGPCMIFCISGALSGPVLGFDPSPLKAAIIARLPLAAFWAWITLFGFCLHNQRRPESVEEDAINKPWRPLPAKRITITQTNYLLLATYPIMYLFSSRFGGLKPCIGLTFLQLWYNDWGGSDDNGFVRNFLNAAGYLCFLSGSLEVLIGPSYNVFNPKALTWLFMVGGLICTTIHAQDFRDEEGDRLRGRNTIQSAIGDRASRWSVILAAGFWSIFIPARLELGLKAGLVLCSTAGVLIFWVLQGLQTRTLQKDILAYKAWCFWFMSVFLVPCVKRILDTN